MRAPPRISLALALALTGCVGMTERRAEQPVRWSDGREDVLEIWFGDWMDGPAGLTVCDVLATPLLLPVEIVFGAGAFADDDQRVRFYGLGFFAAWLPVYTCVPTDSKPSAYTGLGFRRPIEMPQEARAELVGATSAESVEWVVRWRAENAAEERSLRAWVREVRLLEPPEQPP